MNKLERIVLKAIATTAIIINSSRISVPYEKLNDEHSRSTESYNVKNSSPSDEWTPIIYGFGGIW